MPHWLRIYIQRSSSKITGSDTINLRFWATEFMGIQLTGNKSVILSLQWTGGSCMLKKMQAHCVLNILFSRLWASLVAQMIKILQYRRLRFDPWVRKIPWKREWLHTRVFLGFPWWLRWQRFCLKGRRLGFDPCISNILYPLQYSCLVNSMDRRAWQAT